MISLGVVIFGSLGGWIGMIMDHGNSFGGWTLIWSTVGGFVGIWVGYKVGKHYF